MVGKSAMTSAVANRDFMNAICVQDAKIATTRDGQGAAHACVVEVDGEPQCLERCAGEHLPRPLLEDGTREHVDGPLME